MCCQWKICDWSFIQISGPCQSVLWWKLGEGAGASGGWVRMMVIMFKQWWKKLKVNWLKHPQESPKKRNLDQKINDSKPHIWSLSFNFRFHEGVLVANKNPAKEITHFTKSTPVTKPETLLTLKLFQQTYFRLVL